MEGCGEKGTQAGGRGPAVLACSRYLPVLPPCLELSRVPEVSGKRGSALWLLGVRGWRACWGQTLMGTRATPHKFRASAALSTKRDYMPKMIHVWQINT